MHGTDTKIKRKQTYLSNTERWLIATFCIENRCVEQNYLDPALREENKSTFVPFTIWRVTKKTACEEVNRELKMECSSHHLEQSVAFYNEICVLTQSHPNVPAIQDTVEMDMLTAENKRLQADIKEITEEFSKLKTTYNAILKKYSDLFSSMREIARFIPADCFGVKKAFDPTKPIIQR